MSLDQYEKSKVIGKGSYGEVWLARHKKDKKQYVLKKLDLKNASNRERKAAQQEAKLLSKLKHPNIVSYKDSFEGGDGFLYIAMGFCEGGDLYNKLKEYRGSYLEERQVVEWFVQIAMALQYMHERNILHRDLKTQNIFLTKSKIIKVGDLGIARVLDSSSDMATTLIGTPYYMSPELFSNKPYNHKSDVWALGCCVYEMTTLKHAFNAKDMNSLVYKILRGKMPLMPKTYSPELVNLIKAMLNQNPDKRPSVNRILRDPYIKRNIAIFLEGTKKSRRPSSSGSSASRPSSASSRREDVVDGADKQVSEAAKRREAEKRRLQAQPVQIVEENLEPLNVGPDLFPIQEELEGTGESQRSVASRGAAGGAARPQTPPRRSVDKSAQKQTDNKNQLSMGQSPSPVRSYSPDQRSPRSRSPRSSPASSSASKSGSRLDRQRQSDQSGIAKIPDYKGKRSSNERVRGSSDASDSRSDKERPSSGKKRAERDQQQRKSSSGRSRSSSREGPREGQEAPAQIIAQDHAPLRPRLKKKKRLQDRLADYKLKEEERQSREGPLKSSSSSSGGSSSKPFPNSDVEDARPLPPPPQVTRSNPKQSRSTAERESGYGTGASSVADSRDEETPRNPPVSARERRRMQRDIETPRTARSVELDRKKKLVELDGQNPRRRSEDYDQLRRQDINAKPVLRPRSANKQQQQSRAPVPMKPPLPRHRKQPSVGDASSSSSEDEEEDLPEERVAAKNKKRTDKEMNNFISLLDTTLKMNNQPDEEEEEKIEVEESPAIPEHKPVAPAGITYTKSSPSLMSVPRIDPPTMKHISSQPQIAPHEANNMGDHSLTTTGRLWERITMLRKDCIRGLGVEKLKRAYDILDNVESDDMEPRLVSLLGQSDFDVYAGKIWQLKFCEEAAFGLI